MEKSVFSRRSAAIAMAGALLMGNLSYSQQVKPMPNVAALMETVNGLQEDDPTEPDVIALYVPEPGVWEPPVYWYPTPVPYVPVPRFCELPEDWCPAPLPCMLVPRFCEPPEDWCPTSFPYVPVPKFCGPLEDWRPTPVPVCF